MARIQFKAKLKKMYNIDDSLAYEYIDIPVFKRKHCDMNAFRVHKKYGGFANSDLFPAMLADIRKKIFGGESLRLDKIPLEVSVDTSSFLTVVSFDV